MNKLSKDKRDKLICIALATAGICAGIYFLLISSQIQTRMKVEKQIDESRQKVDRANTAISSAESTMTNLKLLSSKLRAEEENMASGDLYSWIIQTMNRFKVSYNVDIPQFSRETMVDAGTFPNFPYKAASFKLHGTAYYHDLGKFIADFENAFPFMRVQNLELEVQSPLGNTVTKAALEDRERLAFRIDLLTLIRPTAL